MKTPCHGMLDRPRSKHSYKEPLAKGCNNTMHYTPDYQLQDYLRGMHFISAQSEISPCSIHKNPFDHSRVTERSMLK